MLLNKIIFNKKIFNIPSGMEIEFMRKPKKDYVVQRLMGFTKD